MYTNISGRQAVMNAFSKRIGKCISTDDFIKPALSASVGITAWEFVHLIDELNKTYKIQLNISSIMNKPFFTLDDISNLLDI